MFLFLVHLYLLTFLYRLAFKCELVPWFSQLCAYPMPSILKYCFGGSNLFQVLMMFFIVFTLPQGVEHVTKLLPSGVLRVRKKQVWKHKSFVFGSKAHYFVQLWKVKDQNLKIPISFSSLLAIVFLPNFWLLTLKQSTSFHDYRFFAELRSFISNLNSY